MRQEEEQHHQRPASAGEMSSFRVPAQMKDMGFFFITSKDFRFVLWIKKVCFSYLEEHTLPAHGRKGSSEMFTW